MKMNMIVKENSKLVTNTKLSKTVKYGALPQRRKPGKTRNLASKNGGSGWIRTTDQGLMSPLLCQLSYAANRRNIT